MRNNIKLMALFLAGLLSMAAFGSCGKPGSVTIDSDRSQLYVAYYNGGLGEAWFDRVVADFEEAYADYEFEPGTGKKGVQIVPTKDKGLHGNTIATTITNRSEQVFLIEDVDYYDYLNYGNLYDITDVVTGTASDSEEKTIEQKLNPSAREFWNMGTEENPQYYALPYHASSMNIIYNVDLFEQMGYYFAKVDGVNKTAEGMTDAELEANLQDLFVVDGTDKEARSDGPDGVHGTADDGLPATYADFFALCEMMKLDNVTPVMWNGYALIYLVDMANELWANYEGAEQMSLNFKLEGEATDLVDLSDGGISYDADGSVKLLESTEIDADNAYMLHLQEGKYQAIRFIKELLSDPENYYSKSFESSFSHLEAQKNFIRGGYETGYGKVGMLIEGTWWNQEGRSYYSDVGNNQFQNRRFAIMPLPKADASQIGKPNTKLITVMSAVFINGNCSEEALPIAKEFLRYLHTDEALNTFTSYTEVMREFDYELTEESLSRMSYFGKSVYDMFKGEESDNYTFMETNPLTELGIRNASLINYRNWGWKNSDGSTNPFLVYEAASTKNKSAEEYFEEIYLNYRNNWSTLITK